MNLQVSKYIGLTESLADIAFIFWIEAQAGLQSNVPNREPCKGLGLGLRAYGALEFRLHSMRSLAAVLPKP